MIKDFLEFFRKEAGEGMENNEKRLQAVAAINSEPEDCYFRFLSEQRDGMVFIIKQL